MSAVSAEESKNEAVGAAAAGFRGNNANQDGWTEQSIFSNQTNSLISEDDAQNEQA